VALRRIEGSPGPPWERPLAGRLDELVVESDLLAGNPLGDPARRPLFVYLPPGYDEERAYPAIFVLQAFAGQLDKWFNRKTFEPNMPERIDALFSRSDVPPCLVVLVDAWTSYLGSQFINSTSTGPYMDYLCDEVVAFVDENYATIPDREHRGVMGHSSGGYGAMVVPMLRPEVFGALASHSGDALFEHCYAPSIASATRILRDRFDGSWDVFWSRFEARERFDEDRFWVPFEIYAYSACYSPDPTRPGKAIPPFDVDTGRLEDEVWERWLSWDPVRMVASHLEDLARMRLIHLDAGRSDEVFLDLGAQAVSKELTRGGIRHSFELFEGRHTGIEHRYTIALEALARVLSL
jgi:S-formylglutathione hydrolase FrmB